MKRAVAATGVLATALAIAGATACGSSGSTPDAGDPGGCDPARGPATGLFVDVTEGSGLSLANFTVDPIKGVGVAIADVDGDGLLDIFAVTRANRSALYRNTGGLTFEDVTVASGLPSDLSAGSAAFVDLDNDGDNDLVVATEAENLLFENLGDGSFADVTTASGIDAIAASSQSITLADLNGDGLVDLLFSNYDRDGGTRTQNELYVNRGNLVFEAAGQEAGIAGPGLTWAMAAFDLDGDGDLDLHIANDTLLEDFDNAQQPDTTRQPDVLFRNDGPSGTGVPMFTDVTTAAGLDMPHSSMGVLVADFDGDERLDLYISNFGRNKLYLAQSNETFTDQAETQGVAATRRLNAECADDSLDADCLLVSWGAAFLDFDLDGRDELLVINGAADQPEPQPAVMFRGTPGEPLEEIDPGLGCLAGRSLVPADLDNDGDLDLVVTPHDGAFLLFRNDAPTTSNWLRVTLVGSTSNRNGIGAVVTATLSGGRRIVRPVAAGGLVHSAPPIEAHFGAGAGTIVAIDIRWPSGVEQHIEPVANNTVLVVTEP